MSVYFYMFCRLYHCQLLGFLNCLYKIFLCLLEVNIPLVNHLELGLSLIFIFLIGRYSSINIFSVFMNALYEASGLDSL